MEHGQRKEICNLCRWLSEARDGKLGTFLWETPEAVVVAGDHQYFEGYCVVLSKTHVREMHNLSPEMSSALFQAVLDVAKRIESAYQPWKINFASFGNVEEHLHWHVIPRYRSDPDFRDQPWKRSERFPEYKTTSSDVEKIKAKLLTST